MNFRALVPFLCLTTLIAINAQSYEPVRHFKFSKLFDTKWYELAYADIFPGTLSACTRFVFVKTDDKHFTYKFGQFNPGLEGDFTVEGGYAMRDKNYEGKFPIVTPGASEGSYLYVLDYDPDYDWIILADNYLFGGYVTALSRTPQNLEALERMLEFTEKHQQNSHHLALHTSKCSYDRLLYLLRKAEV